MTGMPSFRTSLPYFLVPAAPPRESARAGRKQHVRRVLMNSTATRRGRRTWVRFALHYVEMVVAMFAGMMIFGALESGVLALAGQGYSEAEQPGLATTVMTVNMPVGMALWMRIRGHGWPGILEMSGVMFLPLVGLLPLLWAGVVDSESLMMIEHTAMFPLMLVAMLRRRDEYAGQHR